MIWVSFFSSEDVLIDKAKTFNTFGLKSTKNLPFWAGADLECLNRGGATGFVHAAHIPSVKRKGSYGRGPGPRFIKKFFSDKMVFERQNGFSVTKILLMGFSVKIPVS